MSEYNWPKEPARQGPRETSASFRPSHGESETALGFPGPAPPAISDRGMDAAQRALSPSQPDAAQVMRHWAEDAAPDSRSAPRLAGTPNPEAAPQAQQGYLSPDATSGLATESLQKTNSLDSWPQAACSGALATSSLTDWAQQDTESSPARDAVSSDNVEASAGNGGGPDLGPATAGAPSEQAPPSHGAAIGPRVSGDKKPDGSGQVVQILKQNSRGGDTQSRKVVRIAWTFDDGPTPFSPHMRQLTNGMPVTWFVMRSQLKDDAALRGLARLQDDKGDEVAIHSSHPSEGHISWFPSNSQASYSSIDAALADLQSFHALLQGAKIRTKFVRLPYGEHTELLQYLTKLGVDNSKGNPLADRTARSILKGEHLAAADPRIAKVSADYRKFVSTLSGLGLRLWGGSGRGQPLMATTNTWEAESSGSSKRDDNVTKSVSPARAAAQTGAGKFEQIVDATAKDGKPRSLVVLAHDTSQEDVDAVRADINQMNHYAMSRHVAIQYETMSALYRDVRGEAP